MSKGLRRSFLFIILLGILYSIVIQRVITETRSTQEISYSGLIELIDSGNILNITISSDGQVHGQYRNAPIENIWFFSSSINPADEEDLTKRLLNIKPQPEINKTRPVDRLGIIWSILIIVLLLVVIFSFISIMKKISQAKNIDFSFMGKKRHQKNKPNEKFKDVAGIDEVKEELVDIVDFIRNPGKYTSLGGRIPKGVLLIGPPGVGKTLLARAVAGEANVSFLSMSGSEFVEMFVGVGASRVRDLFAEARRASPCIIFIDEIDSLGSRSKGFATGGTAEHDQTLNQVLTEMDGFESSKGIFVIGATNRDDKLDPALTRPGRFDRKVYVNLPDIKGREEILKIHTQSVVLNDDVDLKIIARLTPGFSGADLANLVNEAALWAAKANQNSVTLKDFELAKDKILLGKENKSLSSVMTEGEKKITATHEAGHAIIALTMPENDPLHKVSIIPRGRALGITSQLPESDRHNYTEEYLFENLCILYGGRVAEELIFQKITTGAQNDIERATKIAWNMVCELGMSKLGPINFNRNENLDNPYFISEETKAKVDEEIRNILDRARDKARTIIMTNHVKLQRIADALIEKETLDRQEIEKLFNEP